MLQPSGQQAFAAYFVLFTHTLAAWQAKWVASVLSGRAQLPPQAVMAADVRAYEGQLRAAAQPLRYLHSQVSQPLFLCRLACVRVQICTVNTA